MHWSPWRLPRSPARLPHRRLAVVGEVAAGEVAVGEAAIPAVAGVVVALGVTIQVVAAMDSAVTVALAPAGVAMAAASVTQPKRP